MAQTGYTPIILYKSTTPGAAPLAANLNAGEFGFNISDADMALYAKNASGNVKRVINNPAGLKYPTADGTVGQAVTTDGAGNLAFGSVTAKTSSTGSSILPSGTTAQRDGSPAAGYFRFNTTNTAFEGYNGTAWAGVGGASGGGGNPFVYENDQTVSVNYTLTSGKNGITAGPISINSGITVTVPSGSTWVIV